jgi:glycosyltransferase involved in cell wall biosynthesis
MMSIIIPAHNESSVIARTLSAINNNAEPEELDIVVVCNGCTDQTASIARRFGPSIRVIESEVASKTHALNLGDQVARFFPRIYVDADVIITTDSVRALAARLEQGDVVAAAPTADIDLAGCSRLVRAYFGIRNRLPSAREGIGGSGVYALSESGRNRFTKFPELIADDLYIRVQFKPEERETIPFVASTVFAPRAIRQLIAIRTRAYYGTFELAKRYPELWANKGKDNQGSLIALAKNPVFWPGLLIYCCVNIIARSRAKISLRTGRALWRRDETSRAGAR